MVQKIGIVSTLVQDGFEQAVFYKTSRYYIEAIEKAGGIAILLPITLKVAQIDTYLDMVDAILLPGGGDVSPVLLDISVHKTLTSVSLDKDYFELCLLERAIARNIPVMGICRGLQIMNLGLGGSIFQDLDSFHNKGMSHKQGFSYFEPSHPVSLQPYSALHRVFSTNTVFVNSMHHQGIDELGKGLVAIATAQDGLIEAVQSDTSLPFLLGVQFHPELLLQHGFLALFRYFIQRVKEEKNEFQEQNTGAKKLLPIRKYKRNKD